MIKRYLNRFPHALRGLWLALKYDFGFRTQVYGIGIVICLFLVFYKDLTSYEYLFITLAYFLILITELQNSALEIALDKLHPELNENIGKSKDLAAGAVLLAGAFLVVVLASIIYNNL